MDAPKILNLVVWDRDPMLVLMVIVDEEVESSVCETEILRDRGPSFTQHAFIAQLDRAIEYESMRFAFESQ